MPRIIKLITLVAFLIAIFSSVNGFAQTKTKKKLSAKREAQRRAMHSRDSLLHSLNRADTSINSLLQRVQQYTTTFNQVKNNLADGLDTIDVSQGLPPVIRRIDKINTLTAKHKSSTLRYLFVLRDNLDHLQDKLDDWQSDLDDVNTKLIQNQNDLLKFTRDSMLKIVPSDTLVRKTFFAERKDVWHLWRKTDSLNRGDLLKVNLLQDKIAISYTKLLDESEQIDSKIKGFATRAIDGESDYIWNANPVDDNFKSALNSTVNLNELLFSYFSKNEIATHLASLLFLIVIFSWIMYNRSKVLNHCDDKDNIFKEANYVCKSPVIATMLVATTVTPYFYDHPPAVFLETFFLISIIFALILIKNNVGAATYRFLSFLLVLAIFYSISNLFIEVSTIDRFVILLLSVVSIIIGVIYREKVKKAPEDHLPHSNTVLNVFLALQIISLLLNITGRFSLAKIIGVTAVFNLLLLVVLFLVTQIILQGLFLQFQVKRKGSSIINWIDYDLVQKKFKKALLIASSILWLFFLLQNLNIDDWAIDYADNLLNQSRSIGGATFTFGGFVIFILVIWISSIVSRVISYFYDVSARRVTELSILKKKNRTSALIIRMAVFTIGFLLAVAASGFPLDKLTIIISAFGVGIGFGLQNIVNNLVSGLILAFEKPINIGDVIEVDGASGTMKEIGIRSSKILTSDGSEVIIPNGDLISHHVINWTLSNSNRRIQLTVGTAYGIDINKVNGLLKNLLTSRGDIMTDPGPSVFVDHVDENSVQFKLYFWADDINTTSTLKSNVLTAIYEMLLKEGIEMPSPQKDFNVHFPGGGQPFTTDEKKGGAAGAREVKKNPPGEAQ